MTTSDLLTTLTAAGCRLIPDGTRLRIQDPRQVLTDTIRSQIRQQKDALLTLLRRPILDTTTTPPDATLVFQHPAGHMIIVSVYRCPQCGGTNWGPRLDDPDIWWCMTCHARKTTRPQAMDETDPARDEMPVAR